MVQLILRPSAPFSHPSHPARALLCSRPDLHHLHDHQRDVQLSDFSSHRVSLLSLSLSLSLSVCLCLRILLQATTGSLPHQHDRYISLLVQ
jgi:hypothetical protein